MTSESLVEVTFMLDDLSMTDYERQEFASKLLKQLLERSYTVERTVDRNVKDGSKSVLHKVPGALTALLKLVDVVDFFKFVGEKFAEKPLKVHLIYTKSTREVTIETIGEKAALIGKEIAKELLDEMGKDSANG